MTDDTSLTRLARNQAAFRSVNETVSDVADSIGRSEPYWEFVCECSNAGCAATLRLSLAEYEHVRENPVRFIVAAGHEHPELERVVERHEGYVVVEKLGRAADVVRDQ